MQHSDKHDPQGIPQFHNASGDEYDVRRKERAFGLQMQRRAQIAAALSDISEGMTCFRLAESYLEGLWNEKFPAAKNELHGMYWLHRAAQNGDRLAEERFRELRRGPLDPPTCVFLPSQVEWGNLRSGYVLQPPETAHPRLHYLRRWAGGEARVKVNRFLPDSVMPELDDHLAIEYVHSILQENERIVDGGRFKGRWGECIWCIFERLAYDDDASVEYDLQAYLYQTDERPWRIAGTFRPTGSAGNPLAEARSLVQWLMEDRT